MSDTPRTDGLSREAEEAGTAWPNSAVRFQELARELERENAKLVRQRDYWMAERNKLIADLAASKQQLFEKSERIADLLGW